MNLYVRAGVIGLLLSLLLAGTALAGPAISVRVEGEDATLLPRTAITLPDSPEPNTGCPADSAANAIQVATNGNWDKAAFVQTILGETHDFSNNDYWQVWVFRGGTYLAGNGVCDQKLQAGDELLMTAQISGGEPDYPPTFYPLVVTDVPASVQSGSQFTVKVTRTSCQSAGCLPDEGFQEPAAGATVTAGTATATTNASGVATLTAGAAGATAVRATAPYGVRSAVTSLTVTAAPTATAAPGEYTIPTPTPTATPTTTVTPRDTVAPTVAIRGLKKRYRKAKAPRELRARVADDTGVGQVKIALTRTRKGKCYGFGDRRGKFRRIKCGRRLLIDVGAKTDVSYLLPKKLGRGRYRFDVIGFDRAGNEGERRKRFRVR